MSLDELIEELTRLRDIYGGGTPCRVGGRDYDGTMDTFSLDRVKISASANRCVELLP